MNEKKKIEQYLKNNELDLEIVIDEYSGYVYKIIENMAMQYLSKEDIEEIISDTFFILWKNRNKLDNTKELSPYLEVIFELYYYSSMKISEISNILNISEFSIKSKLFRIRKKIKKELLKGGYSDE